MSLAAMREIGEAQTRADAANAKAAADARAILSGAETAGKEKLNTTREEAAREHSRRMTKAEAEAAEQSGAVLKRAEQDCEALRGAARKKLPETVKWIVERVVNT